MAFLGRQVAAISRIHPLVYLVAYLSAIPAFAIAYAQLAPHGFFAPYSRYDPGMVSDRQDLGDSIEKALKRSFAERRGDSFQAGHWSIDPASLRVENLESTDGARMSFAVRVSGEGTGEFLGAMTTGWTILVSVPEHPLSFSASSGPAGLPTYYHFPEIDLSRFAGQYREEANQLFQTLFKQNERHLARRDSLALNELEESKLHQYLLGVRGDIGSINGSWERMMYFSAVVLTTLGLGDIVPASSRARGLVALEAVVGITFAGLFLNALAFRASNRGN